jgi:hypothetical protein
MLVGKTILLILISFRKDVYRRKSSVPPTFFPSPLEIPKAEFNGKRGIWNPMLELTILPHLNSYRVDNGVQLSTPAQTNAKNLSLFIQKWNNK